MEVEATPPLLVQAVQALVQPMALVPVAAVAFGLEAFGTVAAAVLVPAGALAAVEGVVQDFRAALERNVSTSSSGPVQLLPRWP